MRSKKEEYDPPCILAPSLSITRPGRGHVQVNVLVKQTESVGSSAAELFSGGVIVSQLVVFFKRYCRYLMVDVKNYPEQLKLILLF